MYDKDYKLSYLKNIWQNKYVGISVQERGDAVTMNITSQGDALATTIANAYLTVNEGKNVILESVDKEQLFFSAKLLELYKSSSIIFNKIGLLRHMLVTLFLLSENHINPMPSGASDADLDEEFLQKFQETQMVGINQLGDIISRNMKKQEQLNATMLQQNNEIRQDLVNAMKQMMLAIEERHNEPPKYVPEPKAEEIPCKVAVRKDQINIGDTVRLDDGEVATVLRRSGKLLVVNVDDKERYVLPNTTTKIDKLTRPEIQQRDNADTETEDEYSEDFEKDSLTEELSRFSAAGNKAPNKCNDIEFMQTLNSQERDIILSNCIAYLYASIRMDKQKYARDYKTFFQDLNIRDLPFGLREFAENLFENTPAIDIEDDYYMLIENQPKYAWLSYLRLVFYEVFQLVNQFPVTYQQKSLEFLPFLIYDATLAFSILNRGVKVFL